MCLLYLANLWNAFGVASYLFDSSFFLFGVTSLNLMEFLFIWWTFALSGELFIFWWEFLFFDGHFYYLADNSFICQTIPLIGRKHDEIPFFGGSFIYFGGRIILIRIHWGVQPFWNETSFPTPHFQWRHLYQRGLIEFSIWYPPSTHLAGVEYSGYPDTLKCRKPNFLLNKWLL